MITGVVKNKVSAMMLTERPEGRKYVIRYPYLLREDEDPFEHYDQETEPDQRTRVYAWQTGIGLQAVDQLQTSEYLLCVAQRNIDGEISMPEAKELISQYYAESRITRRKERGRRMKSPPELLRFSLKTLLCSLPRSISPFIGDYFRAYFLMRVKCAPITSPRKNGY